MESIFAAHAGKRQAHCFATGFRGGRTKHNDISQQQACQQHGRKHENLLSLAIRIKMC